MSDTELCQWFSETGHKWRGWPEWDSLQRHGSQVFHITLQCTDGAWWGSDSVYSEECAETSVSYHVASCLIRDFLTTELSKIIPCLRLEYGNPECLVLQYVGEHKHKMWGRGCNMNAALVAAVEAKMREEGK